MSTQLSTKFAAIAVALTVNAMMIGGVGYLFSSQLHRPTAGSAMVMTASARATIPTI